MIYYTTLQKEPCIPIEKNHKGKNSVIPIFLNIGTAFAFQYNFNHSRNGVIKPKNVSYSDAL